MSVFASMVDGQGVGSKVKLYSPSPYARANFTIIWPLCYLRNQAADPYATVCCKFSCLPLTQFIRALQLANQLILQCNVRDVFDSLP